jgi:putative glutamine amidotransferase
MRPLIGVTADATDLRHQLRKTYSAMVVEARGVPVILPCRVDCIAEYLERCDGIILSGGDDPKMEQWGIETHPRATPIDPERQAFELALLEGLEARRETPVLGVCLGMQLMALHAGGQLDQYLPDTLETAPDHWDGREHVVEGPVGTGVVHSHHRQAITDAGRLAVVGRAHDGVIEAVRDDGRPFYLGVQWHPERTETPELGLGVVRALVEAAGAGK